VHSGTISLKSNPLGFDVSLNGKVDDSKNLNRINNSYNINGLIPGEYEIKISAAGFNSWTKKTNVHSGLSSEFWNVILTRTNYEVTSYPETEGSQKFYISPKDKIIAMSRDVNDGLHVDLFDIGSGQTSSSFFFSDEHMISEEKKENIEWSPQQDYLMVPLEKTAIREIVSSKKPVGKSRGKTVEIINDYQIINISDGTISNLNQFFEKDTIKNVRWDPQDKDYVFFMENENLYRASIRNKEDLNMISDGILGFDLSKTAIYYLKKPNNLVFKTTLDGKGNHDQITKVFPEEGKTIVKFIAYDDGRMTFLDSEKNLYAYNQGDLQTYFKKIGTDIEGSHFSDDGKKLLFWSNNEISVYFVRIWEVEPTRSEDEIQNITRYAEKISNVQWSKDYEHIIFNTGRYVKIIELDPRDHRNCLDLIALNSENPFIRYDSYLEKMFFIDEKSGTRYLNSIIFPEPTPLLGIGG